MFNNSVLALGVADKSLGDTSDIISDSSGVGTANSDTTNCSLSMPGTTVVCIESYTTKEDGHISIREGDIIEGTFINSIPDSDPRTQGNLIIILVTGATDDGYLEGNIRSGGHRTGLFPTHCVQEVRLRHHNIQPPIMMVAMETTSGTTTTPSLSPSPSVTTTMTRQHQNRPNNRVVGRRESSTSKHFATAPRLKKT